MKKSAKMRQLMASIGKKAPIKKPKKKEKASGKKSEKSDLDLNHDGKTDEKDLAVAKTMAEKIKTRIKERK